MGDRERTILDFVSCSTVGELNIILDDKFGPEQSEDDLRECFRLLAGGSNKLSREAFVAFYTKVLLFIKNGCFWLICFLQAHTYTLAKALLLANLTVRSLQRRVEGGNGENCSKEISLNRKSQSKY